MPASVRATGSFYFTTCGWMMWNWLVTGSPPAPPCFFMTARPSIPTAMSLFRFFFARDEQMTYFGTSAKFIDAVRQGRAEADRNA